MDLEQQDNTIGYYNDNAEAFYTRSIKFDLSDNYNRFLHLLPKGANILDAGCGAGRDSKYFLQKGHTVTAFDASKEMVRYASIETELPVLLLKFCDRCFRQEFDGVWASASLIHVPYDETRLIFKKIHEALKNGGVFYASYKYGDKSMLKDNRSFRNMTEQTIIKHFHGLFKIIDIWKEVDKRSSFSPSPEKLFLNFIVRKI